MNTVLYIHGKGGSALESEHYKSLFPDCEVIGLDYQTFTPWDTGQEIHAAVEDLQHKSENVILIANSIGAFFSMNAGIEDIIKKAYFISPMVDMEKLIMDMMRWANVTEQELKSKGTIHTDFGEDLSWEYLCYVRSHPIEWKVPTHILYGSNDHLMSIETITDFANKHNATLTIMKDGEHWFHTDEQMMFLDNWIKDMKINKATIEDYESIIAFYDDVTDRTPNMEYFARWQKGKHPTEEGIRAYIEEGSMYLYKENNAIVGAMAVTMYQGEDYHAIEWAQQVEDNEAAVIHILAVSPDAQGKGIGSEMIREAIRLAQTNGMKAIRLDALASNTPAHKIYKALGFEYRGKQHLFAENTGWTDFYFFEYEGSKC